MAPATYRADMEKAALGHGTPSIVEVVADRKTSLVHDGPAFLIYAIGYRKDDRRGR